MNKSKLSQKEYDHLIDSFAQQLWFLRERWEGIKILLKYNKKNFPIWQKYHRFFESVYRSFVYDFYIGIFRLVLDKNKQVESMIKVLKMNTEKKPKINDNKRAEEIFIKEQQLAQQIEDHPTLKKILNHRNYLLAHQNSNFLFNNDQAERFRSINNPSQDEIEGLIAMLDDILKKMSIRGTFCPITSPDTSITNELEEIFQNLQLKKEPIHNLI